MVKYTPAYLIRLVNILDHDPELRTEFVRRLNASPFEVLLAMNLVGSNQELQDELYKRLNEKSEGYNE